MHALMDLTVRNFNDSLLFRTQLFYFLFRICYHRISFALTICHPNFGSHKNWPIEQNHKIKLIIFFGIYFCVISFDNMQDLILNIDNKEILNEVKFDFVYSRFYQNVRIAALSLILFFVLFSPLFSFRFYIILSII